MHRPPKLPELVESIYDAGLDPSLWNHVVAGVRDFVGGQACGLFSKDSISKFGVTHYYCGADPHYIQLYSETHSKFDPLTVLPPHGRIVSVPHASRALLINRAIDSELTLATALADVLDNLASGIFLLDAACRLVHAN